MLDEHATAVLRMVRTNPDSSCCDALAKGDAVQDAGRKRQQACTAKHASLG